MALIAAMEEAQNDNLGSEDLEQAVDNAVEVSSEVADINEVAEGVSSDAGEVENAIDDTDELQAIGDVAQEAVESGEGLSEQAAEVATIAIERIHQRLGFRGKQRIVAATESFGHANTRLHSTKLVVEGIVDTLKSVWASIKAMAKRIWDKIVTIFARLTNNGKALRDQIENLKKRANNLAPNAEMKEDKLDNKSLAKKLSVNKEASAKTYGELAASAQKLTDVSKVMMGDAVRIAKGVRSVLEDVTGPNLNDGAVTKKLEEYVAEKEKASTSLLREVKDLKEVSEYKHEGKLPEGTVVKAYGIFAGNTTIVVNTQSSKVEGEPVRSTIGFGSLRDSNVADRAEALSKGQILEVLKKAGDLAAKIEDQNKLEKEGEDVTKNIMAACDKLLNNVSKMAESSNSDQRHAFAAAKEGVNDTFSILKTLGAQAPTIYLNTAVLGAEYASASLANFK